MGRASYDWDKLLGEYLNSDCENKSEFANSKGINPSFFRRKTAGWPNKQIEHVSSKEQNINPKKLNRALKKNLDGVTEKQDGVTKKRNKKVTPDENNSNIEPESNTELESNTEKVSSVSEKSSNVSKNKKSNTKKKREKQQKQSAKQPEGVTKKIQYLIVVKKVDTSDEELTEAEKLFCFYFNRRPIATQAYMKAFGCNYNTAMWGGSELLRKPKIRKELDRLLELKREEVRLTQEDLVLKHMRIAFAEMTDVADWGQIEQPVIINNKPLMLKQRVINGTTGQVEEISVPAIKMVNNVQFKDSSEIDGAVIQEVKVGRDGSSIKLYDAQKSMDWLEHYFQWNPMDKHKIEFDNKRLALEREKIKTDSLNEPINEHARRVQEAWEKRGLTK